MGYTKAIKFLVGNVEDKNDPDWQSPFVGLPREIPTRQIGTAKGSEVQEAPVEENLDLSFVAAQVITSFHQMIMEIVKEEEMAEAAPTTTKKDANIVVPE